MKSFEEMFYKRYSLIREYFVDDAWPYYIDKNGKIHDVDGDHFAQIENDYNLIDLIPDEIYPNDIGDDERYRQWMIKWMKGHSIYAIVYDMTNKIVYVRAGPKDLNPKQKESIVNFCIKKRSELIYDKAALA